MIKVIEFGMTLTRISREISIYNALSIFHFKDYKD